MRQDRIVAITGGAGALGSALASHLVTAGYRVALLDLDAAKPRVAQLVETLGAGKAVGHTGDFALAATWEAAHATIAAAFGAAPTHGALIAGGYEGGTPLHAAPDDSAYDKMMSSNVDTMYRALHALLPPMVENRYGSIVVVGSRVVERPWTSGGAAAYAASKAAVVAMAKAVAKEVLDYGVRINSILPSTMDTPANRRAMPDADPQKWVALDSASAVIAFFFSEASRDVSGAALPVYGRA